MEVQEIIQAITDSPDLKSGLLSAIESDVFTAAKAKGIIVRTTDEENAFLKSYETSKIDPRVKEIYDGLDREIEEVTGLKRNDKERTFDYSKRVLNALKAEQADLKTKLDEALAGKGDELTKQQLQALKEAVSQKDAKIQELENSNKSEAFKLRQSFAIKSALAGVKLFVPDHVPDADKESYISERRAYIESSFATRFTAEETKEGEVVYKDKDGNILMNTATAKPKTAEDIIKETFKFDFEQDDAGAAGAGSSGKGKAGAISVSGIKDKAGIYEYAAKKGLVQGSKEWVEEVEKLQKQLNIN